jgi:large subunit ribosomal protein L54
MTGLNYLKGRDDPVALKEEEYPEWLWRCLDAKKEEDVGEALDEFCTLLFSLFPT